MNGLLSSQSWDTVTSEWLVGVINPGKLLQVKGLLSSQSWETVTSEWLVEFSILGNCYKGMAC